MVEGRRDVEAAAFTSQPWLPWYIRRGTAGVITGWPWSATADAFLPRSRPGRIPPEECTMSLPIPDASLFDELVSNSRNLFDLIRCTLIEARQLVDGQELHLFDGTGLVGGKEEVR